MATLMIGSPYLLNFDLWVELFSFFIAFLISTFSFYAFLITKQRRHEFFCIGFLFLSAGILLSALFNSIVQVELISIPLRGYIPVAYMTGFILLGSMSLIIAGYMTLFVLAEKITNRKIVALLYIFVILAVLVAHDFYVVFYLIQLILVLFLFMNYLFNYRLQHTTSSLLVMLAFGGLLLGSLLAGLIVIDYVFYVTSSLLRVLSFVLFLSALISIYLKK